MIVIDGAAGEGGGQVLRSALGLSVVTGRPFVIHDIRKRRRRPGLLRQHLTAVRAAARIGCARLQGDAIGSRELTFEPTAIAAGQHHFEIGSAGSACLVLQAILPALLVGPDVSRVTIEGGTHNPSAPPWDFLEQAFAPLLARMGARLELELERPGFFPAGGGRLRATVEPVRTWQPLRLLERGRLQRREAVATVAELPLGIAERELAVVRDRLGFRDAELVARTARGSRGPGNLLAIVLQHEQVTEVCTGFGARGKPAERVAADAVREARRYLRSTAPVGPHLADQLLLPLAMAGAGSFRTDPLSPHATTNIAVIERFLPVRIGCREAAGTVTVTVDEP